MRITEKLLNEMIQELEKQLKTKKIIAINEYLRLEFHDKYKRIHVSNGKSMFTCSFMTNSELYWSIRVCLLALNDDKQILMI